MDKTIATIDLRSIHEIYLEIKKNYPKYGERFLYFLTACQCLDPDIDLEAILELSSYGGLIEIDNSSLDNCLKSLKILRLHAILHDASDYIAEYSHKGSGYTYALPCQITDEYLGHIAGLVYRLFVKTFKINLITFCVCWNRKWWYQILKGFF